MCNGSKLSGWQGIDAIRPRYEVTTTDAYSGGNYYASWYRDADLNRDIRFEGTFAEAVPVPEPSTWLLLASGFVGLAFVARRRRSLNA